MTNTDQSLVHDMDGLNTSIARVELRPNVSETSSFQELLVTIPSMVDQANGLLEDYRKDPSGFVDKIDEDDLDAHLKDMRDITSFANDITKSRKDIKKYLDEQRDSILGQLDERLEGARFGELSKAQNDIKQLKKDVQSERRAKRWEELKPTFDANVARYPLFATYAPTLTDFSRFKILHPKMVSGAKTRRIKDSDHAEINLILNAWHETLSHIEENTWGLPVKEQGQLLKMFVDDPNNDRVQTEALALKRKVDAEEKARIEAEKRRQEELKRQEEAKKKREEEFAKLKQAEEEAKKKKDAARQAQLEKERYDLEVKRQAEEKAERERREALSTFMADQPALFKESFPEFMAYLFENKQYHGVHNNPKVKAMLVYDIMRQSERADSVVSKETGRDPQKVLDLVQFVLDA